MKFSEFEVKGDRKRKGEEGREENVKERNKREKKGGGGRKGGKYKKMKINIF